MMMNSPSLAIRAESLTPFLACKPEIGPLRSQLSPADDALHILITFLILGRPFTGNCKVMRWSRTLVHLGFKNFVYICLD